MDELNRAEQKPGQQQLSWEFSFIPGEAIVICSPSPSTSLYGHTYARRGVHKIFVWTRQVVLTSDSTSHFSLGKKPSINLLEVFSTPISKAKPVCSLSEWCFACEDQLLCVSVQ